MQRLTCLLFLALFAFTQGVAAQTIRVGRYPSVTGAVKAYEDGILARLKTTTGYTFTTVNLPTLNDRITALQTGTVDFVLAQFTVTDARKLLVDFITPYYFGDGAAIFVKNLFVSAYIGLVQTGPNPYANFAGKTFCNEDGSAYNAPLQALGMIWKKVDSQALIDADPTCELTTSDSTATLAGWTVIPGPLVAGSTAPIAIGVPLRTSANANKSVRLALVEASVALYVGTPGSTPIESLNRAKLVKAVPSLKGATAPLATGAKFINRFYTV